MTDKYLPPCRQALWKKDKSPHRVGYRGFEYEDIERCPNGWVDPEIYKPQMFDIVYLKTKTRTMPGWWDGGRWDGYRVAPAEKVLYWKKLKD